MKADTSTVKQVYGNDILQVIPFFQRHYVWTEKNWIRFCQDMESIMTSSKSYFLGALILNTLKPTDYEKDSGISQKFRVVDGQQRLTTLSIYMKILHMMANEMDDYKAHYILKDENEHPTLRHNCEDKETFNKIMSPSQVLTEEIAGAKGNIYEAYKFFLNRLRELQENGVNLRKLLNRINSQVQFVVIELNENDDEQQIFDTINSLGVDLTTDELLKNFLYHEEDKEAYLRGWKPIFDTEEAQVFWGIDAAKSRQSKGRNNRAIDRFLHAFVRVKMWEYKDRLSSEDRVAYVKQENVYSTCIDFVNKFGMSRQELAEEIIAYAKLYKANFVNDILETRIPMHSCVERLVCMSAAQNAYSILPYVLYILRNVDDVNERNAIFGYLEKYLMLRMLAHSNNKNYAECFGEELICAKIKTLAALKHNFAIKTSDMAMAVPSIAEVRHSMDNDKFDEASARLIWYLYETKQSSADDGKFTGGFNDYYAEQLMPQPTKDDNPNWPKHDDVEEERLRLQATKTLANFFLLKDVDAKSVKKIHEIALASKKSKMAGLCGEVTSAHNKLESITTWTEAEITSRSHAFAKHFYEKTWKM